MKRSREYRFEQKEKIIKRRLKLVNDTFSDMNETYANKKNYLSKHDPFDCGKRQCGLCRTCKKQHKKDQERKLPLEDNDE